MPGYESDIFGDSGLEQFPGETDQIDRAQQAYEAGRFPGFTLQETERTLTLMDAFGVEFTVDEQDRKDRQRWLRDRDAAV